jgi:diguanylate cyclase (GGDEF)-like protein
MAPAAINVALPKPTRDLIVNALQVLLNHLAHVRNTLGSGLDSPVTAPAELANFIYMTEQLQHGIQLATNDFPVLLTQEQLSLMRNAISFQRRSVAEQVEATQSRMAEPSVIALAKKAVEPFDVLLNADYLRNINPHPLPRLATYLTAHGRRDLMSKIELAKEEYDPKHRILLSSSILLNDTEAYRRQCEDRRESLAVVFADVDNFKAFNTARGVVDVDRFVLPPILNAVESASYGHGRAYRHGGDEFVVLLPNATATLALNVANGLVASVAALRLENVPQPPRLSVGVWITHPESHLTATELVEAAAKAQQNSKDLGKSRITIRVEQASHYQETVHEVK